MLKPILAFLISLTGLPAAAEIVSVTASPSRIVLGEEGRTNIVVRYRVQMRNSQGSTLFSPNAEVLANGNGVGIVGGVISDVANPGSRIVTRTFTETIDIDGGVIGDITGVASRATLRRIFEDGGAPRAVNIPVVISNANASSSTTLHNLSIHFDDRSQIRTVPQGGALRAQAVLSVQGRGVITGAWQIDDPRRPGGFHTLQRVRKPYAGARQLVFDSPALPTRRPGTYRLRFVPDLLTNNRVQEDWGTLHYTVIPNGAPGLSGGLAAQGPGPASPLTSASRFAWAPRSGAAGYQVEFVTNPTGVLGDDAARVAAVSLPGSASQTRLKPFTLARIANAGGQVYWRVVALDRRGRTLATSAYQPLGSVR